jgi:transcriptional regulator with XRE-family HTH domain
MLRLKEILEKKQITQIELSKKLGVSTVSVNNWAQHKAEPSLKMTLKICDVLKIKLNELVDQKSE